MHESTLITVLLFLFIVIITFCLINKHRNVKENYSRTSKPPSGSFTQSCRKCEGNQYYEKGFLTCECKNINGHWIKSTIDDLRACTRYNGSAQIGNVNGVLQCENPDEVPCMRPDDWCTGNGTTFKQDGKDLYCSDAAGNKWEMKKDNNCESIITVNGITINKSFEFSIPLINTSSWYISADNNVNLSGVGRKLIFVIDYPTNLFSDANGPYVAIKDTVSGLYLRHAGLVLHLGAFAKDNLDFAFKIIFVSSNSCKIYTPFGGMYICYNGKYVAIKSDTLSTATVINVNDAKIDTPNNINFVSGWARIPHDNPPDNTNQTPEMCRQKALKSGGKYVAWGHRNEMHPDSSYKNTCYLYTAPFGPYKGDINDTVHITGCLKPNQKVEWGCETTDDNASYNFTSRIEDTHQDGLPFSKTKNGIGFAIFPANNLFDNDKYYKINSPKGSENFSIIQVQRIDKGTHFNKDVISYQFIRGVYPKSYSDAMVKMISPESV